MFLHLLILKLKKLNKFLPLILIIWLLVLSILYSSLSIIRHTRFQTGGFDLGLYDQAVWQYAHFLSPYNTIKERFILGDHLNLTLPFIAPLFYFWDNVKILFIFQAFWVSFSVLAIYKLIILRKFSAFTAFCLSFVYSLFYGLQYLIFFDFHPIAIGVGLLAWLVYFLEKDHKKLFTFLLILALLTQENMGLAISGIGLIYFFRKQYRKTGIVLAILGLISSLMAAKIISLFSLVGFQYQPEISHSLLKNITGFFNTPEKRLVWLYSLSWFSFLPVFSPGAMFAVILDLAQYFITGPEFSRMWSPFMHHRGILAIFLLLGTLDVLYFLKKKNLKIEIIVLFLVLSALFQQYYFHYPLNKLAKKSFWQYESWMEDNKSLFKLIPPNATLTTQQSLVPHLSHRKEIYLVYPRKHHFPKNSPCGQSYCWWLDFGGKPKLLVVDIHPNSWLTQLLETNENFESALDNMEKMDKIKLVKAINNAKLYKILY